MITNTIDETRTVNGIQVDAKRFVIEGGISQRDINSLIMDYPEYMLTLEHYLVLYKPYNADQLVIDQATIPLQNKIVSLELEVAELKKQAKPLEPVIKRGKE